ncbi:MAG TPA: CHASE3 domain-containing protein [Candidatus Saccharimonadales bacterium]
MIKKAAKPTQGHIWLTTEFWIGMLLLIVSAFIIFGWVTDISVLKRPFDGPVVRPGTVVSSVIVALLLMFAPFLTRSRGRKLMLAGLGVLVLLTLLKVLTLIFNSPASQYVNIYETSSFMLAAIAVSLLYSRFPWRVRLSQIIGGTILAAGVIGIAGYIYVLPFTSGYLTFYGACLAILMGVGILALTVYAFRVFRLRLILFGMFILTALVFTTSATSQKMITDYRQATARVEHTYRVIKMIDTIRIEVADSETGQRGYIITQDESFLKPYNASTKRIRGSLEALDRLIADNPDQRPRSKKLAEMINERLDMMSRSISLVKSGSQAQVIGFIKSGNGNQLTQQIRDKLAEMEKIELELLAIRSTTLKQSSDSIGSIRIISTSIGILLLLVVVVSVIRNIRKLEESQRALQKSNQALAAAKAKDEALLGSIGDGVFALDMKGRIMLFNLAAQKMTGITPEQAIGKYYKDILRFVDAKSGTPRDAFIHKALKGSPSTIPKGVDLKITDDKRIPVADSAAPIYNADAQQTGIIVVFRDITKDLELEKSKDEFVSLTSHQLRTPLSAINWYTEMLLNGEAGKITKDQEQLLHEIYAGNGRMVDLVNSLLNVSRLDLGKLVSSPEELKVSTVVKSVLKELEGEIKDKNIHYRQEIDTEHDRLYADPKLLRMILQNLLSNAVKYTPANGSITLRLTKDTAKRQSVVLSIADTGYGIPHAQQKNIFSKLFRADNVQKLGIEGTGLGLYIVKSAAEQMGGGAQFESAEGKGTTFYVNLPFKKGPEGRKNV